MKLTYMTAQRWWNVKSIEGEYWLTSLVSYNCVWKPREPFVADCLKGGYVVSRPVHPPPEVVPVWGCVCGIYSSREGTNKDWSLGESILSVYGAVASWGKVIQHAEGFRAQYAYPQALDYVRLSKVCHCCAQTDQTKTYRLAFSGSVFSACEPCFGDSFGSIKMEFEIDDVSSVLEQLREKYL